MSTRIVAVCILCLGFLLGLFAQGCGTGPVITQQSFAGRCITYSPGSFSSGDSCGEQIALCEQFENVINKDYGSQQECIDACTATKDQLYKQYLVGCCRMCTRYAWQNCNNYCRANY